MSHAGVELVIFIYLIFWHTGLIALGLEMFT